MAATSLPAQDVELVQQWCERRIPERVRDRLRVECEVAARHVTIVERVPDGISGSGAEWLTSPVARLRYTKRTGLWTLYWRDGNLQFHLYDVVPGSPRIQYLLDEIDSDEDALFWG